MSFSAEGITFTYPGEREPVLRGVDLEIAMGTHAIVLGPNGSGKSTLLRVLLGRFHPERGNVRYRDRDIRDWSRGDLAREVGVVAQEEPLAFPMRVRDYVALGRYPHLGRWRPVRRSDERVIEQAMARCDVDRLGERSVEALSGGEGQRVRIARALAQEPRMLVLDEPTTHLDIRHEMEIFELLHSLARDGLTILTVTHNLNLAGRYADGIMVMDEGQIVAQGSVESVLTRTILERVYRWPLSVSWPDRMGPVIHPLPPP